MIPSSDLWMLGLRPVPPEEAPATLSGDSRRPARSTKYVVAERFGRWRVLRDEEDAGAFAHLDDAVRFACAQAREQAAAGVVGVVVVQAKVQEMHCFTPPPGADPAPRGPRLRVVAGAGG